MLTRSPAAWLILAAVVPISVFARPDGPDGKPFQPPVVFSGTHSQIHYEMLKLVTTSRDWKALWEAHRGKDKEPGRQFTESGQELTVDFETHFVVAVFTGRCDWCEIKPKLRTDAVVVGFERRYNQTEGGPLGRPARTPTESEKREAEKESAVAPYGFVVLPKSVRSVVIEEGVRRDLASPAVWKHRATFSVPIKSR